MLAILIDFTLTQSPLKILKFQNHPIM